jgi:5-oxoprolinase (ATP-hydrolysing)
VGENYIELADGSREDLAHSGQAEVNIDDVMVVCTPGGGGYGKPDQ